jgi:formyltetrahydrofolate deformylase
VGIVAGITGHLASVGGFNVDSQQYADLSAERFSSASNSYCKVQIFPRSEKVRAGLDPIARQYEMALGVLPSTHRPRLLIAVSRSSHCLNDLLYRWLTGALPVNIVGVVANHPELRALSGVVRCRVPSFADRGRSQRRAASAPSVSVCMMSHIYPTGATTVGALIQAYIAL